MRSTNVSNEVDAWSVSHSRPDAARWAAPIGRIFFSAIFLMTALSHFSQGAIDHAASAGVPYANIAVPLSGVIAVLGGLSILLGFKARIGAWLIVIFLVPVTVIMHAFWNVTEAHAFQMQMVNFMKNVSMLGGAFLIAYFGAGPVSVDAWIANRHLHERLGHDSWMGGHPSHA